MKNLSVTIMAMLFTSACSTPVVHGNRNGDPVAHVPGAVSAFKPGEAIIVMKEGSVRDDDGRTECVRETLAGGKAGLRITPETEFRDALFPWFEQAVDADVIAGLAARKPVRNRIQKMGVRYIVEVAGNTNSDIGIGWGGSGSGGAGYVGSNGAFFCGAGAGAAGCLGLMAWARKSDLSAVLWDLRAGSRAATIGVQVSGASVLAGFVLPLPLIAPTETAACTELGTRVVRFITTGELPEKAPEKATDEKTVEKTETKTIDVRKAASITHKTVPSFF